MTPATVVLVHGMGGSPDAWSRVIPLLDRLGIPNLAVELPSCLPESAMNDVAGLQSVLDECIDPVVLVGHSNGGVVVDVGEDVFSVTEGRFAEEFIACMQAQDDRFAWDTDALAVYFVGRGWSEADAHEFVLGCRPQRAGASIFENTIASWRSVPSTFVSCNDSEMSSDLRAVFASRATDVIEMPGDHFPNWLRPGEVADILARISGEIAAQ
jgi:hypothetical protein